MEQGRKTRQGVYGGGARGRPGGEGGELMLVERGGGEGGNVQGGVSLVYIWVKDVTIG